VDVACLSWRGGGYRAHLRREGFAGVDDAVPPCRRSYRTSGLGVARRRYRNHREERAGARRTDLAPRVAVVRSTQYNLAQWVMDEPDWTCLSPKEPKGIFVLFSRSAIVFLPVIGQNLLFFFEKCFITFDVTSRIRFFFSGRQVE
jgi:hypothetical protein